MRTFVRMIFLGRHAVGAQQPEQRDGHHDGEVFGHRIESIELNLIKWMTGKQVAGGYNGRAVAPHVPNAEWSGSRLISDPTPALIVIVAMLDHYYRLSFCNAGWMCSATGERAPGIAYSTQWYQGRLGVKSTLLSAKGNARLSEHSIPVFEHVWSSTEFGKGYNAVLHAYWPVVDICTPHPLGNQRNTVQVSFTT